MLMLQSLFVPYFGYLLDNSIDCLLWAKDQAWSAWKHAEPHWLVVHVLSALNECFLHDTDRFINKERFEKLLQPLVDQLESTQGPKELFFTRTTDYLAPCLTQLAVCVANEVWFLSVII